jgi:hypothetical protein
LPLYSKEKVQINIGWQVGLIVDLHDEDEPESINEPGKNRWIQDFIPPSSFPKAESA